MSLCRYAYKRVSTVAKHDKDIVKFRAGKREDNVADHFVKALLKEADDIMKIMEDIVPMKLTPAQEKEFRKSDTCFLCGGGFDGDKVRDHDHLTGEFRGAAHNTCNLKYGFKNYKIPVLFHNLKGYDSHFIVKALDKKIKNITCIPSST